MTRYVIYLAFLLVIQTTMSSAQVCSCPPASECKPCSGGYTSITLRYNGSTTALVLVKDGLNILANLTLSPNQEFTIKGSKKNEKFADKLVPVVVNGLPNTLLGAQCSELQVGLTYGSFTVVAGVTIAGSTVCCTTPPPDLIAPVIVNMPGTINAQAKSSCATQVTWQEPIATDNCQLRSFTSSHKSGGTFALGTTLVTYTATDEAGLTTTTSFYVVVSDQNAPVFSGTPGDIVVAADELCSASVSWTEPNVTDECSVSITQSHKPNDRFSIGKTKVQYEAKDLSGNTSIISFNVIVEDRTHPIFDSFPDNITATVESQCSARVNWTSPTVSDKCSSVTLKSTHEPNSEFAIGITKVKYTATDGSGNKTERELAINIEDKRKLEITNCPGDISVSSEENSLVKISWIQPKTSGSCEEIFLESNYKPGDLFRTGNTDVEYVATTPSGKQAYCNFSVRIALVEKPLQITKLITPDGDGSNDSWIINNINEYRENKVQVFDRWGGLIYEASRYDNESTVWKGMNRSGTAVPTGTYFYLIVASDGMRRVKETGSIELVR